MPKITFMRHAESKWNKVKIYAGRLDVPASEEGLDKARERYAGKLSEFDVYIVSELQRSPQTLEAIFPEAVPIVDSRITEMHLGDWQGKPKDSMDQGLRKAYVRGEYTPPNAEPPEQIENRVCSFVEEMFEIYDDETTMLVMTHSATLRNIRRAILNLHDDVVLKNLETIEITRKEFDEYIARQRAQIARLAGKYTDLTTGSPRR